jgi:hypothetical protein
MIRPSHLMFMFPSPTWNDEAERITLLGPQRLAVLTKRDEHVVQRFIHRNAARHSGGIRPLGDNPARRWFDAGFVQHGFNGTPVHSELLNKP